MMMVVLSVGLLNAELAIGKKPVEITLDGNNGSKVDGTPWSSNEITGKVWVFIHADPDESDLNNTATEALKAEDFPEEKYASIAMINMAATWKPNALINIILKGKQKDYPSTIYVRDFKNVIGKKWKLADDSNNIAVFNQEGTVLFSRDGQLSKADIEKMISLIKENL